MFAVCLENTCYPPPVTMHTVHISCNFVHADPGHWLYALVTHSSFDSEYRLVSKVSFEVGKNVVPGMVLEFLEALFQIAFLDFEVLSPRCVILYTEWVAACTFLLGTMLEGQNVLFMQSNVEQIISSTYRRENLQRIIEFIFELHNIQDV